MTDVDQKCSIYSNHILDFIFEDRCVSVVDKTDFDYKPPIAAFTKSFVATKRHSERLNRSANSVTLFERENSSKQLRVSLLRLDHSNLKKKMRLSSGEQSNPGPSAEEPKGDSKINGAQCAVLLEQNSVNVDIEIAKKKRGRRPKSVFTPVVANKRKRSYKRKPDRPLNIQYIPLGKTESCKSEGPKMFPVQQLNTETPKEETSNLYIPVSNSKTPICVLKKKNCTKSSKVDNTDIIYSSSIRNIDGKQVPKIVLVKERANKILTIQKNDDTTEVHIEEVNTSATHSNNNFNSDIGKHILPMRISERRSIAEPLRPQPATLVPDMSESQPKLNEENVRQPNDQQTLNIIGVGEVNGVALTKTVIETSDDVPQDLSIKSTRCSRDQNSKPASRLTSRNSLVFSSEKDRVLPNPSLSSRKYFGQPLLQQPPQQQLQAAHHSPRQLSEPQPNRQSPIQKLFIQSPQQSPQQMYLQSARQNYPLRSHIRPPQSQQYLQAPHHSPILQHQHSPLQQMQHQFINAPTYQPRMQYMMQHQAANSMGRQGPLGNSMVRQQPQAMSPQDQQLVMQMMMQQQYPAMQLMNEQQRIVQPLLQPQQHQITQQMVQQQMAELQQPRLQSFSPQQQQLLAQQQAMKRKNENNILIGNRQPDAFRRYPYLSGVPYAPYPHQIGKPPINSPGTQYNSDNSQDYWYNLNTTYPTNLQNKNVANMPEIFETNQFPNKMNPKKRNANTAKVASKSTFDEPPSKVKRPNVLTDFAQDFSNNNANYKPIFSNENSAETYHNMQPTNSGTTVSISSTKNTPTLNNEIPKALYTGRNREIFENITLQNPFNTTPFEESARNFSILRDGKSKLNEFGEYFLNNTEVTIRKLKANENCGSSTLPPLSSASIYNVQNCSSKAGIEKNMLRTALSSNKADIGPNRSSEVDVVKSKISPSTCDPEELDELYQNYISKDIDPLVTTLSNANKRKLFQLSYLMNKRPRADHVPIEDNRQIIVKNDIASSGCIVTDKKEILDEVQNNDDIKIITSDRESGGNENNDANDDGQDSPKSNDTEDLLVIDEDCVVDLSISQQEDNFLSTNIISIQIVPKANEIDDNHNLVQEKVGSSSPKRTIEEELTLLEEVLSNTKVIQTKPSVTRELNNNSSPSLLETVQELSRALSDEYVEMPIVSKLNEECSSTAIDSAVLLKKLDGIENQISDQNCCLKTVERTLTAVNTEKTDLANEILVASEMENDTSHEKLQSEDTKNDQSFEGELNAESINEPNVSLLTAEIEKENSYEELDREKPDRKSCEIEVTDPPNEILLTTEIEKEKSHEELELEELDGKSRDNEFSSEQTDQQNEVLLNSEVEKQKSHKELEHEGPHEKLCENEINTEETDQSNEILVTIEVEKERSPEEFEIEKSCENIIENINSQKMAIEASSDEGNINESVVEVEESNVVIEIDDDTEPNDLTKQHFVISRDIDSMNIVEVTVMEDNTTSEAPPDQSIIACYSVDSSDDNSDDDDDMHESNNYNNEQHEIISISSDSESEPEYVDETVTDGSFRNELQRKFFLKKFKPSDPRRTSYELMHLISNVFQVYIGLDNGADINDPSRPSSSSTSVPINAISSSNISSQANSSDDIHQVD